MFNIREAVREDNEELLRLEAKSPQGTGVAIVIDRDDYFYRSALHDNGKVMIAEEEGKIVGVMAYALKDVLIGGEEERVAYFYDLRGEATYRRSMKRGLFRLWKAVEAEIESGGAAFIYGHVKADNHASLTVATKMGAKIAASFSVLSISTLPGEVEGLGPHLDRLEEEVSRLERMVGERSLRPISLREPYLRGAELGYLNGIYRLEEDASFAQVSAWDLSRIYRGRVVRMPITLRLLGLLLNPAARVLPLPRIPKVGERIAYLQLFDPVCQGKEGNRLMKELLGKLQRAAYANGFDIITLFAYQDDPLAGVPRFFPQKVLHYHTMVWPILSEELPPRPLYLDIRDI